MGRHDLSSHEPSKKTEENARAAFGVGRSLGSLAVLAVRHRRTTDGRRRTRRVATDERNERNEIRSIRSFAPPRARRRETARHRRRNHTSREIKSTTNPSRGARDARARATRRRTRRDEDANAPWRQPWRTWRQRRWRTSCLCACVLRRRVRRDRRVAVGYPRAASIPAESLRADDRHRDDASGGGLT